MSIRMPQVAGSFYPADPSEIRCFAEPLLKNPEPIAAAAKAVILPHAGYQYSGLTACETLQRVNVPKDNVLLGPDHRGAGGDFSIFSHGEWRTPLGKSKIAEGLAQSLKKSCPAIEDDEWAHSHEHSLEVLVPLLELKNPACEIVPILAGTLNVDLARETAKEMAACLVSLSPAPLIVISNDMSHYESNDATRKKDPYALRAIENLDADALIKAVRDHRITMCGFIPVYMFLVMAQTFKIQSSVLVDYRTSAEATGERDRVVGYAGFLFR